MDASIFVFLPIDPPAEIEQYSKRPSKTGQSSPTETVKSKRKILGRLVDERYQTINKRATHILTVPERIDLHCQE